MNMMCLFEGIRVKFFVAADRESAFGHRVAYGCVLAVSGATQPATS